jgi:hypothetical protein
MNCITCVPQGKRYSLPNSRIMIHQPLGGAQGQATDIEIQANEILHHKLTLNGYLVRGAGRAGSRSQPPGATPLAAAVPCRPSSLASPWRPSPVTLTVTSSCPHRCGPRCDKGRLLYFICVSRILLVHIGAMLTLVGAAAVTATACLTLLTPSWGMACLQEAIEYGLVDAIIAKPQLLQTRELTALAA